MVFKKGNIPWNKGLKGWNKGKIVSQKTKKRMSLASIKRWKDPQYRKKQAIKQRLATKRRWENKDYRKKMILKFHTRMNEELRKRLSDANKGKKHTIEQRKKISISNRGLKRSQETKKRLSLSKMREKNPFWLGGKSFEPYGLAFNKELKEQIRKRDNYTCQQCGKTEKQLGYKLATHHIDFNKQNNNPSNLISLCRICHRQTYFSRQN